MLTVFASQWLWFIVLSFFYRSKLLCWGFHCFDLILVPEKLTFWNTIYIILGLRWPLSDSEVYCCAVVLCAYLQRFVIVMNTCRWCPFELATLKWKNFGTHCCQVYHRRYSARRRSSTIDNSASRSKLVLGMKFLRFDWPVKTEAIRKVMINLW